MNEAQSGNGICSVLVILRKKKKLSKNAAKSLAWKQVPDPFVFMKY